MKKFLAVLLSVLMLGALVLGVLAAPGDQITGIQVKAPLPVAGQSPAAVLAENIRITAKTALGEEITLLHGTDWVLMNTVWISGAGETLKEMEASEVFTVGESYQIKVRIRFLSEDWKLENEVSEVSINGKTTTWEKKTVPAEVEEPETLPETLPETGEPTTGGGVTEPETQEPTTGGGVTEPETQEPTTGGGVTEPETGEPTTGGGATEPETQEPTTGGGVTEPETGEPTTGGGQSTTAPERVTVTAEPAEWVVYDIFTNFFCTPVDLTPTVTLTASEKVKTYDGEAITLNAVLAEYVTGVEYRYTWYCEEKVVAGQIGKSIPVANVADSGAYRCEVTAAVLYDDDRESQMASSNPMLITVHPRKITIRLDDVEKVLRDPDPALTYTVEGEIFDELSGKPQRLGGEDIGKYSILIGSVGFAEAVAENYEITVVSGTFSIVNEGQLTMTPVTDVADLSYVLGEQSSTIQVSASRGAIPEGAMISLSTAGQDPLTALENMTGKKILKSFSVTLLDSTGRAIAFPTAAVVRFSIPLTASEVEQQILNTITAGFYASTAKDLTTRLATEGGVNYLVVDIEQAGVVALFEGTKKVVVPPTSSTVTTTTAPVTTGNSNMGGMTTPKGTTAAPTGGDNTFLWILVIVLTVISLGVMIFTLVWTHHNRPTTVEAPPHVIFAAPPPQKSAGTGPAPRRAPPTASRTVPSAGRAAPPTASRTVPPAGRIAPPAGRSAPTASRTPNMQRNPVSSSVDPAAMTRAVGSGIGLATGEKMNPAPTRPRPQAPASPARPAAPKSAPRVEEEILSDGEKMRMRRIADEINAMPPIPEAEVKEKEKTPPRGKPQTPPVIFFDDLED